MGEALRFVEDRVAGGKLVPKYDGGLCESVGGGISAEIFSGRGRSCLDTGRECNAIVESGAVGRAYEVKVFDPGASIEFAVEENPFRVVPSSGLVLLIGALRVVEESNK